MDHRSPSDLERELLTVLQNEATVPASSDQPLVQPDGTPGNKLFYSWRVMLTPRGADLAGRCLLERLRGFPGTQLAGYGAAGMPLLMACLLRGGDRYTGLYIREERKAYGSQRRIEGPADRERAVIVLDDVLGTGHSVNTAIAALREEGFSVEGVLTMVDMPLYQGSRNLRSLGFQVDSLFDIEQIWPDQPARSLQLYRSELPESWEGSQLPDGLHPAVVARRVAEEYLATGRFPRPPAQLDQEYDGRGGTFVSFRLRGSDYRVARDGFWHFQAAEADPCRDLVLATVKAIRDCGGGVTRESLEKLKICVTFFDPLEQCRPGQLDFSRYGIVVSGRGGLQLGGALPNTQVYINELEQYRHAREINAKIMANQPHTLYRHTLTKCVEPGEDWLHFGGPDGPELDWTRDPAIGRRLTARARQLLRELVAEEAGLPRPETRPDDLGPLEDELIPGLLYGLGVTLYQHGVTGCSVAWESSLDDCLRQAVHGAWQDSRFTKREIGPDAAEHYDLSVSLLWEREWLGELTPEEAAFKLRHGLDSLAVHQDQRLAIYLPPVPVWFDWSKEQTARELLVKAGITSGLGTWSTFSTTTWLARGEALHRLHFGFPDRSAAPYPASCWPEDIRLLAGYLLRHLQSDGLPAYEYFPVSGETEARGDAARVIHGLAALGEAGRRLREPAWQEAAEGGFRYALSRLEPRQAGEEFMTLALPGQEASPHADCLLLGFASAWLPQPEVSSALRSLALRVKALFRPDGRITDRPGARGLQADHDHLPGIALWALARHAQATGDPSWVAGLEPALRWHRERFRLVHPWGQVGWQTQGWAAVSEVTGAQEQADFVYEVADWALDWQHEVSGAFLAELGSTGFSFLSAFFAEGMAAAWATARRLGDATRAARYSHSCAEALRFVARLIVRDEDTFCLAEPERALGGVRLSLTTTRIRVDFVSHLLLALLAADAQHGGFGAAR